MGSPARHGYFVPKLKHARCANCCSGKRWRSAGDVAQILQAVECSCAAEAFRAQQIAERRARTPAAPGLEGRRVGDAMNSLSIVTPADEISCTRVAGTDRAATLMKHLGEFAVRGAAQYRYYFQHFSQNYRHDEWELIELSNGAFYLGVVTGKLRYGAI